MLTAYIARMIAGSNLTSGEPAQDPQIGRTASAAVQRALSYLQPGIDHLDEPYVIASYALAALDFGYRFKPRFGMKALSAPSILYDYYNPEAHVVVEPTEFMVN